MWRQYFTNATIYGIDILPKERVLDELIQDDRVVLYTKTDAYDKDFVCINFKNKNFDMLLDDGPHSLESQKKFIELYSPLLSENGILIIEDVGNINSLEKLKKNTPQHLKQYIKTYDLRNNKGRFDDIVFAIDKVLR